MLGVDNVVEVDLESLTVRSNRLVTRTTGRATKLLEGWGRSAVWLRRNTIAYAGWAYRQDAPPSSTGVLLLDVATGESRMLDRFATGATRANATLLTYGGNELRGYRLDGSRRFMVLAGTDTGYVQVAGRHAYVGTNNSTRFTVLDVERAAGRTARTPKPTVLLAP